MSCLHPPLLALRAAAGRPPPNRPLRGLGRRWLLRPGRGPVRNPNRGSCTNRDCSREAPPAAGPRRRASRPRRESLRRRHWRLARPSRASVLCARFAKKMHRPDPRELDPRAVSPAARHPVGPARRVRASHHGMHEHELPFVLQATACSNCFSRAAGARPLSETHVGARTRLLRSRGARCARARTWGRHGERSETGGGIKTR